MGKKMKVYEVTLEGFDGGTDETDHLILWITAPNVKRVFAFLDGQGIKYETVFPIGVDLTSGGIDYILTDEPVAS